MSQTKTLNIVPDDSLKRIHLSQGDLGRTLIFKLFEGSASYSPPAGATVKIVGTKPSGFGFSESCDYSGNTVTCVTTSTMTDEYGAVMSELVVTNQDETEIFKSANFMLLVEKDPHPAGTIDGDAENPVIANLNAVITQATYDWLDEHPEATTTVQDGSITEPKLASALATKINNKANTSALADEATTRANADTTLSNQITALQGTVGSPLVASTVVDMTDTTKVYVYVGSETGYTSGNWYYYNGTAWVSGGIYNAVAVETDTTLSVSGMAADAKATGDQITDLNENLNSIDEALGKHEHSTNYLNPNEIISDTQINANGLEETYTGRNSSGWIPAKKGDTIYFSGINADGALISVTGISMLRLAWYNSSKTFIGATTWANSYTITADNVAYIRFTYVNSTTIASTRRLAIMFTMPTNVVDVMPYIEEGYEIVDSTARNMIRQVIPDNFVDAWGDSRIANGAGTTSVDEYLADKLGWYTTNHGYGGQGSGEIAIKMGAMDCYVSLKNNQIVNGDNVITAINVNHGTASQNVMQNSSVATNGVPCSIGGVDGYLWNYGGTPKFTTASTLSSAVSIMPMTKVILPLSMLHRFIIIWAGKNDFSNYNASGFYEYLADVVSAMAEHIPHNRFVILGETATSSNEYKYGGTARTVMDNYNNLMANRFPNNFIDIQSDLVEHGLEMAGITPTETDISDIEVGWLPDSLMSDETHQNATCRNVIAQIIYEFMQNNGWI